MDFYYTACSPPCRAVMLTAKSVGVTLNKKELNLLAGEQMKPEFLSINFRHCLPTLVDGDLKLWESRAICTYLVSQYGKDDALYPANPKQRVLVDRLLYFDMSLYSVVGQEYVIPILRDGEKPNPGSTEKINELLSTLNKYLDGHSYAVGNHMTVADFTLVATVSSIEACGIDMSKHANVVSWFKKCKENIPGYATECGEGANQFGCLIKAKLAS